MSQRVYTYSPDYWVTAGELGDIALTFTAVIEFEENRFGPSGHRCEIKKVTAGFEWGAELEVTSAYITKEFVRQRWEAEILKFYKATLCAEVV